MPCRTPSAYRRPPLDTLGARLRRSATSRPPRCSTCCGARCSTSRATVIAPRCSWPWGLVSVPSSCCCSGEPMTSIGWFIALVAAVGVERLVELVLSQRHIAWAKAQGGVEVGAGHYPAMVVLHVGLLVGSVLEVVVLSRAFYPQLG